MHSAGTCVSPLCFASHVWRQFVTPAFRTLPWISNSCNSPFFFVFFFFIPISRNSGSSSSIRYLHECPGGLFSCCHSASASYFLLARNWTFHGLVAFSPSVGLPDQKR